MIRNLLIISGSALVLCLASLGGAAALGGHDLARHDWTWVVTEDSDGDGSLRFHRETATPDVTRTLAWTGGDRLIVDLPADVTYVQGAEAGVVVSGPKASVDRVRLVGGRVTLADGNDQERGYIRLDRSGLRAWSEDEVLKITVTAPAVDTFRIAGSGDLTIENYNQPSLELLMDGSGDVEANGRALKLDIRANGSGDADLEGLEVNDARIDLAGSGDVSAGPTGAVQVDLSGSGDVNLTRKARSVQQEVSGSGEVSGA